MFVSAFDYQLHSGRASGSDKERWWRFETKAAVNQVFSRSPGPEIGRKRGARQVLALPLIEQVEGIEYGNWMAGMGGWRWANISPGGISSVVVLCGVQLGGQ